MSTAITGSIWTIFDITDELLVKESSNSRTEDRVCYPTLSVFLCYTTSRCRPVT